MIKLNIQRFAHAEDYSDYQGVQLRKTATITLYFRQLQMLNFYNLSGQMFISLGKTTPWSDPENPDISDTYPPVPSETQTVPEEMIGCQRITWKKFALPYTNPTTAQKKANDTVYYKGLYYKTYDDPDEAIAAGCTAVLVLMTADRDEYFPTNLSVRQACLIGQCKATDIYLDDDEWENMSTDPDAPDFRGNLIGIQNFNPLSRNQEQLEKYYFLLQF